MKDEGVTKEGIMRFLVGMDERLTNLDERVTNIDERLVDMSERMATKDDLEQLKEEIIAPIIRAVDKDAETIYNHGKRIITLEHKAGIIN